MHFTYKLLTITVLMLLIAALLAGCGDKKSDDEEPALEPKEIVEDILYNTKNKNYDKVENYSRSFTPDYLSRYFSEKGESYSDEQLAKYQTLLEKMFTLVSYENLTEKVEEGGRTATVSGTFTTLDLNKFEEVTDMGITEEMKTDFDKEMTYLNTVLDDGNMKSAPYTAAFEFKKSDDGWYLADKNQLILLTLGYYTKAE